MVVRNVISEHLCHETPAFTMKQYAHVIPEYSLQYLFVSEMNEPIWSRRRALTAKPTRIYPEPLGARPEVFKALPKPSTIGPTLTGQI